MGGRHRQVCKVHFHILLSPVQFGFRACFSCPHPEILHRLTHFRRHDIPVHWLVIPLLVLHWFKPLLWCAFCRRREDLEMASGAAAALSRLALGEARA
ncbi:MAG: hypothetical protein D9V47_01935 [Clostridia bacterium]|nr:MAG: hypothetical protein D9V47_01935 [Clostridia bacterium]